MATTEVRKNPDESRYELLLDGRLVGIADYSEQDDVVVLPHTKIAPELQGRGLGAVLVQGALDDVRSRGGRVVPLCWYVAQFLDEHPEYRDLRAA